MRGRPIARQPAQDHRLNHALAKIVGNCHPRRLPLAARMRKQNLTDSGIPQPIQSVRIPL
jgi:hypothetical protein